MYGPKVFNMFLAFYHQWPFRIGLILIMAGVGYHAFNGLRIILMDFTEWGTRYHRSLWYGVLGITTVIGIPVLIKVIPEIFGGA